MLNFNFKKKSKNFLKQTVKFIFEAATSLVDIF